MTCSFCNHALEEILDFGDVALAGAFLKASSFHKEKKYPLRLMFCPECYAVQLSHKIDANTLFAEYFYFSSQINIVSEHFKKYAKTIIKRFKPESVLEIGCNDGVLLGEFANHGVKCLGVDPAKNVVNSINDNRLFVINDFFTRNVADLIVRQFGKQRLVLANNVFAHIPDINDATNAINRVLHDDGVVVIETHYLGKMIEDLQYDWIYHEHIYYYSLLSLSNHLKRHGLMVFDAEHLESHGGSMRFYVCKKGMREQTRQCREIIASEIKQGLDNIEVYEKFANRVKQHRIELKALIDTEVAKHGRVSAYGASGRANTIMQWVGLDGKNIMQIIDDAPAKQGFYTPGTHIQILANDSKQVAKAHSTLILAWPYLKDIRKKVKGRLIVPLPHIEVLE